MKRLTINASNLHVGGGVQVAASFIFELSRMKNPFPFGSLVVCASSEVDSNLVDAGFVCPDFMSYEVVDVYGLKALFSSVLSRFSSSDLVFTVFGPFYSSRRIKCHIVGFAQAWIVYPNNDAVKFLSLAGRFRSRLKFFAQWLFFRRADRLVVELQHVKSALVSAKNFPSDRVDVVPNCVSAVYLDPSLWRPINRIAKRSGSRTCVRLGYVSRDYSHKNLDFVFSVFQELKRISSFTYEFYVTLSDEEWLRRSRDYRSEVFNVGVIDVAQCPTFYSLMDGVFFPSLLESFSATPLEAMVMRRPLFASDRGFVRDCCGEYAQYFDPLDAVATARILDNWFAAVPEAERNDRIEAAYRHVLSLPNSKQRAEAYVQIILAQFNL